MERGTGGLAKRVREAVLAIACIWGLLFVSIVPFAKDGIPFGALIATVLTVLALLVMGISAAVKKIWNRHSAGRVSTGGSGEKSGI